MLYLPLHIRFLGQRPHCLYQIKSVNSQTRTFYSTRLSTLRNKITTQPSPWTYRRNNLQSSWRSHSGRNYSQQSRLPSGSSMTARKTIVPTIVVSCIGVFGWLYYTQEQAKQGSRGAMRDLQKYRDNMVLSPRNIQADRWWTSITSIFAHATPVHLIVNMMALSSFGPSIAHSAGALPFAVLFFGSGLAGSLSQVAWWKSQSADRDRGAVGASGAISGLLGFVACVRPRGLMSIFFIPVRMATGTALFAAGSVACLQQGWLPWMGHADHLGGLAYGVLYALLFRRIR